LARRALQALGREGWEVCITFVSLALMRRLNQQFRGIDRPTDVLSFGEPERDGGSERVKPVNEQNSTAMILGDIVIAPEVAHRNARQARMATRRELQSLVLHGILHLCGYDHETDNGEMQRLERELRRRLLTNRV
jgi:probable rRNA maturation factor